MSESKKVEVPAGVLAFWRGLKPRSSSRAEAHSRLMKRLRKMTPHQVFLSSVAAGIHDEAGHLRPPYADSDSE